jgi:hypothetical protein
MEGGLWRGREDFRARYGKNLEREAAAKFLPVHHRSGARQARG